MVILDRMKFCQDSPALGGQRLQQGGREEAYHEDLPIHAHDFSICPLRSGLINSEAAISPPDISPSHQFL